MEIIVVDDGSVDDTRSVAERGGAKVVTQEPAGLNAGRNRGAEEASGEVLAFLDDDILADRLWAREMTQTFLRNGCDAAGGRVVLAFESDPPRWLHPRMYRWLSGLDLGDHTGPMPENEEPYGVNCAVTREAFARLNGFRAGLDREGDSLLSGGDAEFFARVRSSGGAIWYAGRAEVTHRVPSQRLTKEWMLRRAWWGGVSDIRMAGISGQAGGSVWREALWSLRAVPILAKGIATGRGAFSAKVWMSYMKGRRHASKRGTA